MINRSLFELVKSLGKAEKRHIKLYRLDQARQRIYARLFDVICKCNDRADGVQFLETLQFTKKKLNNVQNYLYYLILSGLRNFNSESSVRIILKNMLIDAEILFKRGLIRQSLRKLDQAKTTAEKYLLRDVLLEVGMQKQLVLSQTDLLYHTNPGFKSSEIVRSIELQKNAVSDLKIEIIYKELFVNYFSDNSKFATKQMAAEHLRQLLKNPLLHVKVERLSMEAWSSLTGLKNLAYFFAGNYKDGIKYAREHLNGMEMKYLHIAMESPDDWAALVYNYLGYCFYLKQYNKVIACLDKIRHILTFAKRRGSKLSEARLWFNYYLYQLVINTKTMNFENLDKVVKGVINFLESQKRFIRDEYVITLNYLLAYNFFIKGDFKTSLFWLNKNIYDTSVDVRPDYQSQTRILYFIVQLERRNEDLYGSAYDSFVEYLEERSIVGEFESVISRLIEDIMELTNSGDSIDSVLLKFKKQLNHLRRNEVEKRKVEHYFDYGIWVESKIKKESFIQSYKKRMKI